MRRLITFLTLGYLLFAGIPAFAQTARQDTLRELMRRIDILTEEIENSRLGETAARKYESRYGLGPAAAQVYHLKKTGVSIAGYGEIVYQKFSEADEAKEMAGEIAEEEENAGAATLDYLRHVVYLGFRFNERLLFNSELEIEHGSTGEGDEEKGEVSMEFGYIDARLSSALVLRAGMMLAPVGIINEFHEPPTYSSVLRPEVETAIIPATWSVNGIGAMGLTAKGFGYRLYLVEGLNAAGFSASGIRNGRQNGSKSLAENLAITGRLDYTGVNSLNLGASFYTGNSGQGLKNAAGNEISGRVTLWALHGIFVQRGLELRGLLAQSAIGDTDSLNRVLKFSGSNAIGKNQTGFYLTAAYDILPLLMNGRISALLPFVQYEKLNTQSEVGSRFIANAANERTNLTYGVVFKPHPNVAFKLDYLNRRNAAHTAVNQFNMAMNYLF